MSVRPPRLAVWLLSRRLSADWLEFVLGDLEEEFHARCASSLARAHRWFWRQTLRCLVAPPRGARASAALHSSQSPGDSIVHTLAADLRYSVRSLFRAPGFAVAVIVDAPDNASVAGMSLTISASGAVNTKTVVLLTPEEIDQASRKGTTYTAPGH